MKNAILFRLTSNEQKWHTIVKVPFTPKAWRRDALTRVDARWCAWCERAFVLLCLCVLCSFRFVI